MTEEALMELNDIRNRNFVYEGQVLALAASARAAPPVEAQVPVEDVASAPAPEPRRGTEAPSRPRSAKPKRSVRRWFRARRPPNPRIPRDYSVGDDDNVIRVQAAETLGHYAEWLDVRASDLRSSTACRSRRRSSSATR